ncbi:MAG: hypothetical protein AB7U85_10265 [Alphaproteobacteria bacterium]
MNDVFPNTIYQVVSYKKIGDYDFYGCHGTAFTVYYNNKIFVITAKHCLKVPLSEQELCFCNFTHNDAFNLPYKKLITSKDKNGNDMDIAVFEVDMNAMQENIKNNAEIKSPDYLANKLLSLPHIQKIFKKYSPDKALKKLKKTNAYKKQNDELFKNLKNSKTSLINVRCLKFEEITKVDINNDFSILGYPLINNLQEIEYDENGNVFGIKQHLQKITGTYLSKSKTTDLYSLKIKEENWSNLNGFSGSPVIQNNRVVGMVTNGGNNQIHFLPFDLIYEHIKII